MQLARAAPTSHGWRGRGKSTGVVRFAVEVSGESSPSVWGQIDRKRASKVSHPGRLHVAARHDSGDVVPPDFGDQSLYRLLLLARFPPAPTARARKGRDLGRSTGLCGVQVGAFAPAPVLVRQRCLCLRRVAPGRAPVTCQRGRGGPRLGPRTVGYTGQTCRGSCRASDHRLLGLGNRECDLAVGLFCRSVRQATEESGGLVARTHRRRFVRQVGVWGHPSHGLNGSGLSSPRRRPEGGL
jgi:hypothetical protein